MKREGKGYPLKHPVTGESLPLPENLMVCPRCGNDGVVKIVEADNSPTSRPVFKCHDCRIDFTENMKGEYCSKKGQITPEVCQECEILKMIFEQAQKVGVGVPNCPFFLGTMGEHFVPEGWQPDVGADDKWGKTRWEPKELPEKILKDEDGDE